MKRRRRKRLRIDRILYCLIVLVLFILLIKFSIYTIQNVIIYNTVKKENTVKLYDDKVKVWKKTISYIQKNKENITIKYKKNFVTFKGKDFKNGMNIKLNMYKKFIDEPLFDNVKTYYIESNDTLKNTNKIKIKLPNYLNKYNKVDVYSVKGDNIELFESGVKITDKYILFRISQKYDNYFVTYIKAKSISSSNNIKIEVGDERDLNITINPSNATNKRLTYEYDKKYISLYNGTITALKKGKTKMKVISKYDNIEKEINITISEKPKETIKEEPIEEVKEIKKYQVTNVDGITYVDGIMIVNKTYSLPSDYNPGGLTDEFMNAFYEMQAAARLDNIELFIASGFRSYDYQVGLYNKYVEEDGVDAADRYSARPGYSEHQTGLAADINAADSSFDDTPEALWMDQNCYKYGFIIRFPKGKEEYTGYKYESWHLRYVGKDIALKIHNAGENVSLEEYYKLTSYYEE